MPARRKTKQKKTKPQGKSAWELSKSISLSRVPQPRRAVAMVYLLTGRISAKFSDGPGHLAHPRDYSVLIKMKCNRHNCYYGQAFPPLNLDFLSLLSFLVPEEVGDIAISGGDTAFLSLWSCPNGMCPLSQGSTCPGTKWLLREWASNDQYSSSLVRQLKPLSTL